MSKYVQNRDFLESFENFESFKCFNMTLSQSVRTLQLVSPSTKVMKNGSKDFSDFLHEVRGPKSKFGSTAGFRAKNPKFFL